MGWTSTALALVQVVLLFTQAFNVEHWEVQQCTLESRRGETCWLHLDDIRPAQLSVGHLEVQAKGGWEVLSATALVERRWAKQPPIIIGPRGFQLIDNHHHCRSLFDSRLPNSQKWMYFTVLRNWSGRSLDRYDFSMFSHTYLWPFDEKGLGPVDPSLFPRSLGDLLDDPFRSLAYLVRSRGGFDAVHLPFQEFRWANFFRKYLHADLAAFQTVSDGDEAWCRVRPYSHACLSLEAQSAALDALLPRALELASSDEASLLPGFIQPGSAAAAASAAAALSDTAAAAVADADTSDDTIVPFVVAPRSSRFISLFVVFLRLFVIVVVVVVVLVRVFAVIEGELLSLTVQPTTTS